MQAGKSRVGDEKLETTENGMVLRSSFDHV